MLTNLSNKPIEVLTGLDNVIIPQLISAIPNGRTLDMGGFTGSTISAGWVIVTDGKGTYKPLSAVPVYEKTKDAAVAEGKTYYTLADGVYSPVAAPQTADIAGYYEPTGSAAYGTLPEGFSYAGILAHSLLASKPAATIMTAGQVNEKAAPNNISEAVKTAVKAALPGIQFITEEYA